MNKNMKVNIVICLSFRLSDGMHRWARPGKFRVEDFII